MKRSLQEAIQRFTKGRVLVVGDLAIDEMVYGSTARLSREAPVIILNHERSDIILGAAGNAAHNIASLQAKRTAIIGVAGTDYYFSHLVNALQRDGVDASGLIQDEDRPTTTKTRVSGIANQSVTQQIVRIDRESKVPVSGRVESQILDQIQAMAPDFDAILISDYGLGVLTPTVIDCIQSVAKAHQLILTVDSQQDLSQYQGASILTPNQPEAEANIGYSIHEPEALSKGGHFLLEKTQAEHLLITLGSEGMALFTQNHPTYQKIPVFNRSEVFDVTGAGDTVIGTLTLALATGTPVSEAAILGNLAASIVVKRFGASTTTPDELLESLTTLEDRLLDLIQEEPVTRI